MITTKQDGAPNTCLMSSGSKFTVGSLIGLLTVESLSMYYVDAGQPIDMLPSDQPHIEHNTSSSASFYITSITVALPSTAFGNAPTDFPFIKPKV
jgi:hypothetical protein